MIVSDFRKTKIKDETVVTIGSFDGVHIGHRFLMEKTRKTALASGYKSAVLTFSPHPREFFLGGFLLITTDSERELIFDKIGLDYKIFLGFNSDLSALSPSEFIDEVLVSALNCRKVIIGENFSFGKNKDGNAEVLAELCAQRGIASEICESVTSGNLTVSSARIRGLISDGNMEEANLLLGEPYFINSEIIRGKSLGRTLGFPTINQFVDCHKLLPKFGVYYTEIIIDGKLYNGITNVGVRPTVDGAGKSVETFVFDFNENVYGKMASVKFLKRGRDEIRFDGVESLKKAISNDKNNASVFFAQAGNSYE